MAESSKSRAFVFDDFRLDADKLMLYRHGREITIPAKVAKTLVVLVERAGSILSKDEVIERVWEDSIVEESNLTQYLYLLRKTLGSMPDGRPYIETLRRRGYRFNGDVRQEIPASPTAERTSGHYTPQHFSGEVEREGNVLRVVDWQPADADAVAPAEAYPSRPRSVVPRLAIAATLLLIAVVAGFFLWPKMMPAATTSEQQSELSVVRLTNGLYPSGATISPDGNVFTYHEMENDICRMFVQQTGQLSRIEITSSSAQYYAAKTFTPDNKYIFYVGVDRKSQVASVYRIPTMGGGSVKILDDIHGAVSFAPDGKEFVFTRLQRTTGESWLVIASSDGKTERIIAQRSSPKVLLPSPAWSPDGSTIAYADEDNYAGDIAPTHRFSLLNVATGKSTFLSTENWEYVFRIVWSPDGKGVFAITTREGEGYTPRRDQVYFISFPDGRSHRLTNEGNRHDPDSLGVTSEGEVISISSNRSSQIWVMNSDGNANSAVQLTRGAADGRAGIGLLPDGRFAYLARNAEELTIMLSSADRSSEKQIATGLPFIEELRADPQGRFFVFASRVKEDRSIYRIDADGTNLMRLTSGGTSIDSTISPDGKQLVFDSVLDGNDRQSYTIKRMSTDGGEAVTLVKGCYIPTFSPDGSLISCVSLATPEIIILSAGDGKEVERHPLSPTATWNFGIGWTSDGTGLVYIGTENGVSNIWVQPRDGGKTRQLTNFTSGIIYRYAFSPDGSKIYLARGYPTQDAFLIRTFRPPIR